MTTRRIFLAAGLGLTGLAVLSAAAVADSMSHGKAMGPIVVEASFARASASPVAKSGAAYVTVTNKGGQADRLVGVKGDAARRIELHTHKMKDGKMTMTPIKGGVTIAPGETVAFAPGGRHIMLMGLHAPLVEGETLKLTLVFEKAGEIPVDIPILGVGAMGHDGMNHGSMDHGDMNPEIQTE